MEWGKPTIKSFLKSHAGFPDEGKIEESHGAAFKNTELDLEGQLEPLRQGARAVKSSQCTVCAKTVVWTNKELEETCSEASHCKLRTSRRPTMALAFCSLKILGSYPWTSFSILSSLSGINAKYNQVTFSCNAIPALLQN